MPALIEKVLEIAAHEVGVHEVGGNNEGQRVALYQACTGGHPGDAWCADFVSWCGKQAPVPLYPRTGDTWALEAWAVSHHCLDKHEAERGDIFLLMGSDGRPEHTGLVCGTDACAPGYFRTIEGNTSVPGQAYDGVCRKVRKIADCEFVRWETAVS